MDNEFTRATDDFAATVKDVVIILVFSRSVE